jgi:hypothetical protein
MGANQFAADRANDLERGCDPGELFGHVLAEHLHWLTAVRAIRFGLEYMILARQMYGKRLLRSRFVRRCVRRRRICTTGLRTLHIHNAAPGGQILKLSLERLDLPLQLLGLATELHAPELVDLCLELLNLDIAFGKQTTGLDQQGPQEFDIVREIGAARHAP